jgi:glycosyltransferase involved in cell wall biosynthesis
MAIATALHIVMGAHPRSARGAQDIVRDQLARGWRKDLYSQWLAGQAVLQGKLMRAHVTVVVPCYRCTETIERAVTSIIRQTLLPEEVLLVEDYSDDGGETLDSLYRLQQLYQDNVHLKVITLKKNGGPAGARNAGWDAATQPYIAFLDADDEWHPEKLDIQYRYMRENPKIAITGHGYTLLRDSNPTPFTLPIMKFKNISPISLLFHNCFPTSSVMLKNSIPFRFTAEKRCAEDFYLWQQIAFAGFQIVRIEARLVQYYKALYGEKGLSGQLWKMEMGELGNFAALYRSRSINGLLFIAATSFSIMKYVKRQIDTWARW